MYIRIFAEKDVLRYASCVFGLGEISIWIHSPQADLGLRIRASGFRGSRVYGLEVQGFRGFGASSFGCGLG